MTKTSAKIRDLNDKLRTTFNGGRVLTTRHVDGLPDFTKSVLFQAIRAFDTFTDDNDPYGEHDLGRVEVNGEGYFWKIDYYAPDMQHGSEDPADPQQTVRVMTIMHTSEY